MADVIGEPEVARRARGDSGSAHLVLGGLVTIFVVLGSWFAWSTINENNSGNPAGFTIGLKKAEAFRDTSDFPVVVIDTQVDYQSDVGMSTLAAVPTVRCQVRQVQTDRTRQISGSGLAGGAGRLINVQVTASSQAEEAKFLQGEFTVDCQLYKNGVAIAQTDRGTVVIPKPGDPGIPPTGDDVRGTYDITLTANDGKCPPEKGSFIVKSVNGVLTLDVGVSNSYDAPLGADLSFTVDIPEGVDNPWFVGLIKGQFNRAGGQFLINGTADRRKASVACATFFNFSGKRQ
jgi:hypothetical protein